MRGMCRVSDTAAHVVNVTQELRVMTTMTDAKIPVRAHADDAGLDLIAALDVGIPPGGTFAVGTGISVALPEGTVGMICPRSGLAAKQGVTVLNAPGIIDAGYRGEGEGAFLVNHSPSYVALHRGDRIAQLVIVPIVTPTIVHVEDLDETDRGDRGFGSTGLAWKGVAS
jgi:dUTP pyrophosphatase